MKAEEKLVHSQKVKGVFKGAASRYDLLNTLLSFGVDKIWRRKTAKLIGPSGKLILDVCAGTGNLSFEMLRQGDNKTRIVASDFSGEMLDYGRKKARRLDKAGQIEFVLEDATALSLGDKTVDAVAIAFGVRNVEDKNRLKALQEFYRVTKRGGQFFCLEFTHPSNLFFSRVYFFYLSKVVPLVARLFSEKPDAYIYLVGSVKAFPNQENLVRLIEEAGWSKVKYRNFTFGIVAIHQAVKN